MKVKKKIAVLALMGVLGGNFCTVGLCMKDETKASMYLPESSWVVPKIEEKFAEIYKGKENWKKEITLSYSCVKNKGEGIEAMPIKAFDTTKTVTLRVPVECDFVDKVDDVGDLFLSVVVNFEEPIANIREVMTQSTIAEGIKYSIKAMNPSSRDCKKEIGKIAEKEHDSKAEAIDLENGENIKIFPVSMGTYTWGYVLVASDKESEPLFWCCQGIGKYEESNFYELKEVLASYWTHEEQLKILADEKPSGTYWI